jgi:uncharacterized protein (DUF697 family)/tellurite resistance protein
MNQADHGPIVAIAMLAAAADGTTAQAEQDAITAAAARIGSEDVTRLARLLSSGKARLGDLAALLSDDEARRVAYQTAVAVCHADGAVNATEQAFLDSLRQTLGLPAAAAADLEQTAGALSTAPIAAAGPAADAALDELILQQAMLTGALEILPDSLANIAILPLQLRLVYQIGQRHGQKLDAGQVKDLAATLGLGAAAQAMEGVVMKVLGGFAGGLLGGLAGGAARVATGAAVTFAATYALGHVADRYYAQGRRLSTGDLRALFAQFQAEARTIYPRVQQQIHTQSSRLNLQSVLAAVRGA